MSEYDCPSCKRVFNDKNNVLWHIWIHHWGETGLKTDCPGCGEELDVDELRQHLACIKEYDSHAVMRLLSLRRKQCPFCSHNGFNREKLAEHVRQEHLSSLAPENCCPGCGEDLDEVNDRKLENHYPSLATANGMRFDYRGASTLLACPKCLNRASGIDDLIDHIKGEHDDFIETRGECNVCDNHIKSQNHIQCIAVYGSKSPDKDNLPHCQDNPAGVSPYPAPSNSFQAKEKLDTDSRQSYYEDLRSFVKLEKEASRKESWRKYRNTPIYQLKSTTNVISELVPIGQRPHPDFDRQYVFERPVPEDEDDPEPLTDRFQIYPKEEIILGSVEDTEEAPIEGVVTFTDDQTIGISPKVNDSTNPHPLDDELTHEETLYHVVHLLNPKPFDREKEAISKVSNSNARSGIVYGHRTLTEKSQTIGNIYAGKLNQHQKRAVSRALGSDDVFCIHGPPGTGKTRTLTAIIELAVARGERVLACAHSNSATDNLLVGTSSLNEVEEDSLHATVQNTDIAMSRVGHNSENPVVRRNYMGVSHGQADIVGSTTNAAAELDNNEFDVVVVDEATQATQPATFVPWLKGDKIVLAGDHRQLPPYCSDETARDKDMHISLFEHILNVYGEKVTERLDVQYRMNSDIAEFAVDTFYNGSISHGNNNKNWRINGLSPILGIDINGKEKTDKNTKSKYNLEEAKVVAKSIRLMMNEGVAAENIGIITPYTAQIKYIYETLNRKNVEDYEEIKVDTVDSFQGSERKAILVSFVRSNDSNNSGFLEFPDEGKRRLNVAITRAQRRLVLIGDWDTLDTPSEHRSCMESCADVYKELAEYLDNLNRLKTLS
jgi:hypothetical protein